jgi:AhpD family alkylhydroperoxidase
LAIAVTTHCDSCITVHVAEALKHGASEEEIAEALRVAVALNAGGGSDVVLITMDTAYIDWSTLVSFMPHLLLFIAVY